MRWDAFKTYIQRDIQNQIAQTTQMKEKVQSSERLMTAQLKSFKNEILQSIEKRLANTESLSAAQIA